MMNNKNLARLAILTLCLTFVSTSLLGGTLAMYTSEVSATATATVADWNVTVNGDEITVASPSVSFDLFSTTVKEENGTTEDADVKTGSSALIAPGTGGKFELVINNASEVSAKYEIALTAANAGNIPIEYSKDGTNWVTDITTLDTDLEGELLLTGTTNETQTIYWKWAFYKDDAGDIADTALGIADSKASVTVTANITVTQLN